MAEDLSFVTNNEPDYDDNEMDMDYMDINDDLEPEPSLVDMSSHHHHQKQASVVSQRRGHRHNQSYAMDQRTQALIKQYETNIAELQMELKQSADENEALTIKNETLIIEYDAKIDELNLELDQTQIESQQYQLRYSEINEELHELRSHQTESLNSDHQNKELLIRLQNKEQNEMALIIDLEQANKTNDSLKEQNKNTMQNLSKLQNAIIKLKKEKTTTEKKLQSAIEKLQISQQTNFMEIESLSQRNAQLQRENEIYRQNLSAAEQEKMQMQNEFTEATMDLLHDELNEAHGDVKKEQSSLRLGRLSSSDMTRAHLLREDSVDMDVEPETPQFGAQNNFIKQRFLSQGSLPGNDTLFELDGGHSRKASMQSMGGYEVDPVRLKQDIRDIMVEDIKVLINQEMANLGNGGNGNFVGSNLQATEYKDDSDISYKMDLIMSQIKNMQTQNDDSDGLEVQMYQFKESIIELLANQKNDTKAFEESINEIMNVRLKELLQQMNENKSNNNGQNDNLNEGMLKETISSQMIQLQLALEKQIGNTISESVEDVIKSKLGNLNGSGSGSNIDNEAMNVALNEIKDLISENMQESKSQNMNDFDDKFAQVMNGKIDLFMDSFRKEVVPEVQAVFEQLSMGKRQISSTSTYIGDVDDEKAGSNRNELMTENTRLQAEIDALLEEKSKHDEVLRAAATSKVHQVVRLQNLLDHMRDDNRLLQYQLMKYREKFAEIREDQENNNMVNKFWGYFGGSSNGSSYVST